jgi:hypothetical protein
LLNAKSRSRPLSYTLTWGRGRSWSVQSWRNAASTSLRDRRPFEPVLDRTLADARLQQLAPRRDPVQPRRFRILVTEPPHIGG